MDEDVQQSLQKRRYAEALEQLLDRYENKVFGMALAFLKNPGRAEEVTQDIFLRLWQALPEYDGRAAPGTWLYTIARNACRSALRSESYRQTTPLDQTIDEPVAAPALDPSTKLGLTQCIDRLPETQRLVITLFYLEDKQIDEVARLLDLPEGTVKSHLHRARRALAEMMRNDEARP